LIEAADKQIAAIDQNKIEIQLALNEKQKEKNLAAKNVDDSAGKSESSKIEARRELDARLAEFERLKAQLDRNIEAKDRAVKDKALLEKQLKDAKPAAPSDPKAVEAAAAEAAAAKAAEVAKAAEAAKAAADPEARARARMEKELADQKSGNKDQSVRDEILKLKETIDAPFPELKVGGKTEFKDLVQEQKDAINHLLENLGGRPIMGQTPGDERGKESWEKQLKKSTAEQKALFDAINDQILIDRKKKLDELEKKQNANKTSEAAPAVPKELSPLARSVIADLGASLDSQIATVTSKAVNIAGALPPKTDITDVTAGLTINADVATLNSKGMNMTLDNSAEVAKMIALTMTPVEELNPSQKDQSLARSSFESTIGDLKTQLAKQKDTDDLLLAAVQELVRIQKNGVEVQQKIYRATV
jgi:hypothetical protein